MTNVYPAAIDPDDPRTNPSLSTNVEWLENDAREVYNVKNFGALGNNSANDSAACQAAIDAMPSTGAVLFFPAGMYRLTTGLSILNKDVIVRGVARSFTTPQGDAAAVGGADVGGSKLLGNTSGMTLMTIGATSGFGSISKHAGPSVEYMSFEDPTYIARQVAITNITWSGGTATVTVGTTNPFQVGDVVYIDKVVPAAWTGVHTIVTRSSTQFTVVAANGGTYVSGGQVYTEDLTSHLTMTGLTISAITRWNVRRCWFGLLSNGFVIDPATKDASWGSAEQNSFMMCNRGQSLIGSGSQSGLIWGGDWTLGTNQAGIYINNPGTQLRIGGMKFDLGKGTSGSGAVGVDLQKASNFDVGSISMENDIDSNASPAAVGIRIGQLATSFGDIHNCHFQGSLRGGVVANIIGIELGGPDSSDKICGANIVGCTFNSSKTAIHLNEFARNITVVGGGVQASDNGIIIDDGAQYVNLIGFQHAKNNTPYTHISDPGGAIVVQIGCSDFAASLSDGVRSSAGLGGPYLGASSPTGGQAGDLATGHGLLYFQDEDGWQSVAGAAANFEQVAAKLITSITATSTGDTAVLTYTIPANTLAVGQVYAFEMFGDFDSPTVPVGQGVRWKCAGNGAMLTNPAPTASQTNAGLYARGTFTVRSIASTTATCWSSLVIGSSGYTAANRIVAKSQTTAFTCSTTSSQTLEVIAAIGASPPAGTTIRVYECVIERLA